MKMEANDHDLGFAYESNLSLILTYFLVKMFNFLIIIKKINCGHNFLLR